MSGGIISFSGSWYGSGSSKRVEAGFLVYADGRYIITETESGLLINEGFFRDLNISSRLGNTPRYITFENGKFETGDNNAVDMAVKLAGPSTLSGIAHILESRLRFIAAAVVLLALFIYVTAVFGVPAASRVLAERVPDKAVEYMSREVMTALDRIIFSPSGLDAGKREQIETSFKPVYQHYHDLTIEVDFRDGGILGANALALPDGTIIFTDQLVKLARNENELISVLLHEVGHVYHKHGLRSVIQGSFLVLAFSIITGDASAVAEILGGASVMFYQMAYSRKFEFEADEFAVNYMIDHNIPLHSFGDILTRLTCGPDYDRIGECPAVKDEDAATWAKYLSTHPPTAERVARFSEIKGSR